MATNGYETDLRQFYRRLVVSSVRMPRVHVSEVFITFISGCLSYLIQVSYRGTPKIFRQID